MNLLKPTELVNYIQGMTDEQLEAYALTARQAITLGGNVDLCNLAIKTVMREQGIRANRK